MSDAARRLLASGLFGAEVVDGAERHARQRHLRLGHGPGDAEVGDFHPPVATDEDVPGLHVAVDDSARVGGLEGSGGLGRRSGRPAAAGAPRSVG